VYTVNHTLTSAHAEWLCVAMLNELTLVQVAMLLGMIRIKHPHLE